MSPSTISIRNAMRKSRVRARATQTSPLILRNRAAKTASKVAWHQAQAILAKAGVTRQNFTGRGVQLYAFMKAAALTIRHGFSPLSPQPTYKHLHSTKGFREVPA